MRSKKIKTSKFVEECLAQGMTSPSLIQAELEKRTGKKVSDNAITMAIKRSGVDRKALEQKITKERNKDILEHQRVKDYLMQSRVSGITERQKNTQIKNIQTVWDLMSHAAPESWTYEGVINAISTLVPSKTDDATGKIVFEKPSVVEKYLSAVSTFFPNVLPKGWGTGLRGQAGENKDYLTFSEYALFIESIQDTEKLSLEGWRTCFKIQVNGGMREGTRGITGIVSLMWENIDYETRRCSIRDKGGKGHAARLWKNVPLDLFPWLNGWAELINYHKQCFGYEPTNEKHATGRVFPIKYEHYRRVFHSTRKRCNSRIAGDLEKTMHPHVIRMTHAQWLVKLRVPLERICGQFPDGRYGVGWDNPLILLKYYVTLETDEEDEINNRAQSRMEKLGLVPQPSEPKPLTQIATMPIS